MIDREELEAQALAVVSPENYYDLADTIKEISDKQLRQIIACEGDFEKEMELFEASISKLDKFDRTFIDE